jgi:hypothetical protein
MKVVRRDEENRHGSGIRSLMTRTDMVLRALLTRTKMVIKTWFTDRLTI